MARKTTKNNKKVEKETNTNNFIQTVILAVSESENFFPLTKTIPKLLLPIANVPAIDYILEMLQKVDTEEILIISSSEHCEKIQRYLDSSKYSRNKIFIFKLIPVISQNGNCDALRRIEQMDIIRSEPFILISSIPVTNFDLKPVIEIHRRNFKENRHNFITCVMKEYPKNHRNLSVTDNNFIVVTTPTKTSSIERILNFSQNWDNFDISKFVQNGQLNIRQGFVDIGIDICSLSVLRLCFDNFDYRLLRLHLLKNAIESEIEEMIAHIYVPDEKDYFGVVKEMKSFDSVTKDIIGNWAYPLGPQNNFYEFGLEIMEQSFIHPSAQISSTAKIKSGCIIAQNCKIGANSILEKTVLGPFSQIGENNKIENSYFLSGATIQDNCSVLYSFSGNNVTIGKNCLLNHATVVADNVKIDENTTTKQFSVIK
ncbi:translation initiation factor eIF-2B epsilon subunit, GEF [Bonamia ostreae]|uniref:Translation initiation factor eIF-2B epsilon subunit, GEF n=1 Tax=Bonamia ostreae TaxID=126728 RepID=A0ABV2ANK4_9EUKA